MQLATVDPAVSAPRRAGVPFTAVAVLGFGSLVTLGVGLALYLGITTVTENTRRLYSEQSDQLIESVVGDIETHLRPVVSQGQWVADYIERGEVSLDDRESLDHFVNGALAATPQVAGIVIVTPDGMTRRWAHRGQSSRTGPAVRRYENGLRMDATSDRRPGGNRSGPNRSTRRWCSTTFPYTGTERTSASRGKSFQ